MAKLKKVVYLNESDYETMLNEGHITVGDKTYLLDENTEYRILADYSPVNHTHSYEELKNKPIGNGTVTINQNGNLLASFQLNTSVPSSSRVIRVSDTTYSIGNGSTLGTFSPIYIASGTTTYSGVTQTSSQATVNSPSTASNSNFPVGVDSLGRAFVNIPFPNEPDIIIQKQYTTSNSNTKYTAYTISNSTYGSVKIFTAWISYDYLNTSSGSFSFPSGFFSSTPFIIGSLSNASGYTYFAIYEPSSTGCQIVYTGSYSTPPNLYLIAVEIHRNGQITSNSEYVV